jgi:hypothetical protein
VQSEPVEKLEFGEPGRESSLSLQRRSEMPGIMPLSDQSAHLPCVLNPIYTFGPGLSPAG